MRTVFDVRGNPTEDALALGVLEHPSSKLLSLDDRSLLLRSGVPPQLAGMVGTRSDPYSTRVQGWIDNMVSIFDPESYADPKLAGAPLVMYGEPGSGKTITALRVMLTLISQGWYLPPRTPNRRPAISLGWFIDWQELSAEFRRQASGRDDTADFEDLERYLLGGYGEDRNTGGQFLVIDDVSRERRTEFNLDRLHFYLRYRVTHALPTIITTNFPPGDWEANYGPVLAHFLTRSSIVAKFEREPAMVVPQGRS